jgi:sugar/nucleoside kinase (ribokinase family)
LSSRVCFSPSSNQADSPIFFAPLSDPKLPPAVSQVDPPAPASLAVLPLKKVTKPPAKDFLRKGFLNSRQSALPMDFDHNWESDVWEKNDEFWEKLSAKWVVDEGQTKEFRTIWAR